MVDIVITENAEELIAVTKQLRDMKIRVAAIDDLIRIKKQSGRKQDLEDVKALEKLK